MDRRLFRANNFSLSAREKLASLLRDGNTVADYRADTGVTGTLAVSSWANQIGAAPALEQGTGPNQPIYLPYAGQQYIYLPAVAGNTVTSPNKSVTGSQSISFSVALNDYTPAADVTLVDKSSGNNGFQIKWLTTDKVRLVVGDGASLTNVDCVASSSFTDGTQHTVRIDWADGVGATFFLDGVQSGSQVAAAKTLTNAAVAITVGSTTSIGKLYSLTIGSVYSCDPLLSNETTTNGATWVASTGETWTLNNTGSKPAQIVGSSQITFDGSNTWLQSTFTLNQPAQVYAVLNRTLISAAGSVIVGGAVTQSVFIYQGADTLIKQYAGSFGGAAAGSTQGAWATYEGCLSGANSGWSFNGGTRNTGNPGANNPGGITLGRNSTIVTEFWVGSIKEVIVRNVADSAATRALIYQYLKAIHGTP